MIESEKQQPELKKKTLTAKQKKLNNFSLGHSGEQLACDYLKKLQYKIVDTNVRVNNNEIDIIALNQEKTELVFIEVKTRSNNYFGTPDLAVSNLKVASMILVAKQYLRLNHCNHDYRFDIIAITYVGNRKLNNDPHIEHFENITWP